jgi:transposase InsO family protein
MREHGLSPKQRRRYVTTTDSDHDEPIFPNLAADMAPDGPNQLWVADITYVAIATGFVYLAAILDAWSRRVVGYAISRSIDARLTIAALDAAVRSRAPPAGCVHHSDRGSQYAALAYRKLLAEHKLAGSMGRRGNPYDNAKAESFMKTLKVEAVYPMAYETVEDVMAVCRASSISSTMLAGYTHLSATAAPSTLRINTPSAWSKPQHDAVHRKGRTPVAGGHEHLAVVGGAGLQLEFDAQVGGRVASFRAVGVHVGPVGYADIRLTAFCARSAHTRQRLAELGDIGVFGA